MDIRTREAVRYLGYGKCAVDEKTLQMIRETFKELEQIAEEKSIYRIFEVEFPNEDEILIGSVLIKSKNLFKNIKGCEQVVVFGATLGAAVDRLMRKYEIVDMSHAVVVQACAAAMLEEYCDALQENIASELEKERLYLRPRFSPGYGDFEITHQKDVLQMIDASKRIGLSMTEGCMLTPTKSVTALIGISKAHESCNIKGCEVCTKADCVYRRSES